MNKTCYKKRYNYLHLNALNKMKKTLAKILLLTGLTLLTPYSKNISAVGEEPGIQLKSTIKVGDKMPTPKGRFLKQLKLDNITYKVYIDGSGSPTELETHKICNNRAMERPFIIYLYKKSSINL